MEHIMENDTLPELTDQEYESIKNIEDAITRDGLDGTDPLKQNRYSTTLVHLPTNDKQMEPTATTAASTTSALKGPQLWPLPETVGSSTKTVTWETQRPLTLNNELFPHESDGSLPEPQPIPEDLQNDTVQDMPDTQYKHYDDDEQTDIPGSKRSQEEMKQNRETDSPAAAATPQPKRIKIDDKESDTEMEKCQSPAALEPGSQPAMQVEHFDVATPRRQRSPTISPTQPFNILNEDAAVALISTAGRSQGQTQNGGALLGDQRGRDLLRRQMQDAAQ